jgi:hypothetical protein
MRPESVQVVNHPVKAKVRWSTSLRVYNYSLTTSFLFHHESCARLGVSRNQYSP